MESRRKVVVRSMLRIRVGHQVGDAVERGQAALARFAAALGALTPKGRAFSAATRVSKKETAPAENTHAGGAC